MVLAQDGADGFTTKAIARHVGLSDGSLFRHFSSKEEIVLAAMDLLGQELAAGFCEQGDALAQLESFFRHRAAFVAVERSVGRLIFSDELAHLAGEAGRSRAEGWRQNRHHFLITRLETLQGCGRAIGAVDPQDLSMLIQGCVLTFALQATLGRSGDSAALQSRIDQAWTALWVLLFPAGV